MLQLFPPTLLPISVLSLAAPIILFVLTPDLSSGKSRGVHIIFILGFVCTGLVSLGKLIYTYKKDNNKKLKLKRNCFRKGKKLTSLNCKYGFLIKIIELVFFYNYTKMLQESLIKLGKIYHYCSIMFKVFIKCFYCFILVFFRGYNSNYHPIWMPLVKKRISY